MCRLRSSAGPRAQDLHWRRDRPPSRAARCCRDGRRRRGPPDACAGVHDRLQTLPTSIDLPSRQTLSTLSTLAGRSFDGAVSQGLLVVIDGLSGVRNGGGASVNHLDIAPVHAGLIQGEPEPPARTVCR